MEEPEWGDVDDLGCDLEGANVTENTDTDSMILSFHKKIVKN